VELDVDDAERRHVRDERPLPVRSSGGEHGSEPRGGRRPSRRSAALTVNVLLSDSFKIERSPAQRVSDTRVGRGADALHRLDAFEVSRYAPSACLRLEARDVVDVTDPLGGPAHAHAHPRIHASSDPASTACSIACRRRRAAQGPRERSRKRLIRRGSCTHAHAVTTPAWPTSMRSSRASLVSGRTRWVAPARCRPCAGFRQRFPRAIR